jgi:hypothetical protein
MYGWRINLSKAILTPLIYERITKGQPLLNVIVDTMKGSELSLGTLIRISEINIETIRKVTIPIIFCSLAPRLKKLINDCNYQELSLNKELAKALVEKDVIIRSRFVADEVMKIVSLIQGPILLTDYEMLFDPRYNIDVLKLFYELSRRAKMVIKWCGALDDNRLVYATPAYSDFHSYNIHDYDIICVI